MFCCSCRFDLGFFVYFLLVLMCLVASASVVDSLERLFSEMTLLRVEWDVKLTSVTSLTGGSMF